MTSLKQQVAQAALEHVKSSSILGIGSGSTVDCFIDELASLRHQIEGCVAASLATEARLKKYMIPVLPLSAINELPLYIDGADEITRFGEAIKGGGGALAREKVLAHAASRWICLVDESKLVKRLGAFPLAVEVLPMARSFVAREIVKLGGDPVYRAGILTDNQNQILDIYHLNIEEPLALERAINLIPGVVENGLFAARTADLILVATRQGIHDITPHLS
ncbi:MAG: ribose-5-phosphate isomerase RpiA [Gammaproteobacteria bacterium]|nr:ribose-5-phosphate isomerase RpiA [Gammaproteobacteria bacterium]